MAIPINYLAIIVAVVVNMVLGFLWYGPVFGKPWMKEMGIDPHGPKPKNMGKNYFIMFIGSFLMAFVLKHNVVFGQSYLGITGFSAAFQAGFWNWLGFIAPVLVGAVLWEKKSWKLFFLNSGYYLVALILMAWILVCWV